MKFNSAIQAVLPHNPGGNYGYTCLSLTTQTFRYGGCLRAALIHWQSLIS